MPKHRFAVGQTVRIIPSRKDRFAPRGYCTILRHLPPDTGDNQYRVACADDGPERLIRESELEESVKASSASRL